MDSIPHKRCSKCGEIKPLKEFTKANWMKDGRYPSCKVCKGAQAAGYRATNLERVRERARQSQAMRVDKHRASGRAHYAQNREKVIARTTRYNKEHPDIRRKSRQAWLARNRDRNLEDTRKRSIRWRAENPDKSRNAAKRRLARVRGAEGSHTLFEWQTLKAQYDYHCLCCGKQEPEIVLTEDHIIPVTKGGSDYISNIQPLCGPCNSAKRARFIDYRPSWPSRFEQVRF